MSRNVRYIDATLRDMASPPWGSAVATDDLVAAAAAVAPCGPAVMEVMDAGCAAAALSVRSESPWDRLRAVAREIDRVTLGVVTVGRNAWGRTPLADDVIRRFVAGAADTGVSRIRGVDPLNDADALSVTALSAQEQGLAFVPTLIVGPAPEITDPVWLEEAAALAGLPGAGAICLSDKAGHLAPPQLRALVGQIAERTGLPVEVQVQAPGGLAPLLAVTAAEAGADAVQASAGAAALVAARPSAESLRAGLSSSDCALDVPREEVERAAREIGRMIPEDRLRQAAAGVYGAAVGLPPDLEAALAWRLSRYGMARRAVEAVDEAALICREVGGLTLSHPVAELIVAQAANHVITGARWEEIEEGLAEVALGRAGHLRGPVDPAVLAAAEGAKLDAPAPPRSLEELLAAGPAGVSEEDLLLHAQFGEGADGLLRRRRSLGSEALEVSSGVGVDRELIETMVDVVEGSDNSEVTVEIAGARVTVKRSGAPAAPAAAAAEPGGAEPGDELARVESPIVGTFYRASSPEAGPFVSEGSRVSAGDVLCLVEAMKLFNEIVADTDGTVREIAVENGEPVEFGQLLFLIEP
jgi:oxaloacetate decarboxylase alpha subunit